MQHAFPLQRLINFKANINYCIRAPLTLSIPCNCISTNDHIRNRVLVHCFDELLIMAFKENNLWLQKTNKAWNNKVILIHHRRKGGYIDFCHSHSNEFEVLYRIVGLHWSKLCYRTHVTITQNFNISGWFMNFFDWIRKISCCSNATPNTKFKIIMFKNVCFRQILKILWKVSKKTKNLKLYRARN